MFEPDGSALINIVSIKVVYKEIWKVSLLKTELL